MPRSPLDDFLRATSRAALLSAAPSGALLVCLILLAVGTIPFTPVSVAALILLSTVELNFTFRI